MRACGQTATEPSSPERTNESGRSSAAERRGSAPTSEQRPLKQKLSFSVERILAPEFGRKVPEPYPVWIYCSRFSARPTAGPRRRSGSVSASDSGGRSGTRTAFTDHQVSRLRAEFERGEYLSEEGRRNLALELGLTEAQVKIWFQNARAKRRRSSGGRQSPLARKLAEAGLYNHTAAHATSTDAS